MEATSFNKYFSLALLTLCLNTSITYAADALPEAIGRVVWVKNSLKAQQPNAEVRVLARRSAIYVHDTIISEQNSSGEVSFTDDSSLSLQENSSVKIDQYSHKQDSPSTDAFVLSVIKGGFRTVTGAISKNNPGGYKATTPVGTIGVMGTMFSLYYNPLNGQLDAKLDRGSIKVSNKQGEVTLTKCGSSGSGKAANTACVNRLYAEIRANSAPQVISTKPAVFNSEPPLTVNTNTKSSGGLVGSFCIN